MIARIVIPIIIVILFTDVCIDRLFLRKALRRRAVRIVWWVQTAFVCCLSLFVASARNFAPDSLALFNGFLLVLVLWLLPKLVLTICSLLGWGHCKYHKTKTNWGVYVGFLAALILVAASLYAYTTGFDKVTVRRVEFFSKDLPKAFDGYTIVQFSDVHVGTYSGSRKEVLRTVVDSINAQHPDMIAFTGDLQNMQPSELASHWRTLSLLHAPDGVFSVLGNHDYAYYIDAPDSVRELNCREMSRIQKRMGWTLLKNESSVVRRNGDSIFVAGMEYGGLSKKVPPHGDLGKTLNGIDQSKSFILMLQHDPTSWRLNILPHSKVQLTLSGHTHGGQIEIFGLSPASLSYREWGGMYYEGARALNVSTGVGGFVPFRIGCPGEIVVITLRSR